MKLFVTGATGFLGRYVVVRAQTGPGEFGPPEAYEAEGDSFGANGLATGDVTGDASLRREGRQEERKGETKDELERSQDKADAKAEEVANLERRTS